MRVDVVQDQAVAVDDAIEHLALLNAIGAVERRHVQPRERATQHRAECRERLATVARTADVTRQTEGRPGVTRRGVRGVFVEQRQILAA